MRRIYIPEGIILTVLAADTSGMQGQWAAGLGLPFGSLSAAIFLVVPLIFIAVSIPAICKRLGHFQHIVHIVALACIAMPVLIFSSQSESIPLRHWPEVATSRRIHEQYKGRIMIMASSAVPRAYFPRSAGKDKVAKAIFAVDPTLNPNHTAQAVPSDGHRPASRVPSTGPIAPADAH